MQAVHVDIVIRKSICSLRGIAGVFGLLSHGCDCIFFFCPRRQEQNDSKGTWSGICSSVVQVSSYPTLLAHFLSLSPFLSLSLSIYLSLSLSFSLSLSLSLSHTLYVSEFPLVLLGNQCLK